MPFTLDGADRETEYRGISPVGSITLEMLPRYPHLFHDETGRWYFGSWENGSPLRTRVVAITTDTVLTATLYKYRQAAPTPITRPTYQRKLDYVRLLTHPVKAFSRLKTLRDERAVSAQAQLTLFEDKIRDVMDVHGVFSDLRHQYIAYALALDKTQRTMRFMVDLMREHQILRNRFENRGLDSTVLDAIDTLVIYRG